MRPALSVETIASGKVSTSAQNFASPFFAGRTCGVILRAEVGFVFRFIFFFRGFISGSLSALVWLHDKRGGGGSDVEDPANEHKTADNDDGKR